MKPFQLLVLMGSAFVFPFSFETGVTPAPNPPAPFEQGIRPNWGM